MNNRYAKYLMVLMLSAYFLFAGMGFNVIKYCCDSCADHGIEEVANMSCSAIHHHSHESGDSCSGHEKTGTDYACSDLHHQSGGCHLLRLSVEIPSLQNRTELPAYFSTDFDPLSFTCILPGFEDLAVAGKTIFPPPEFSIPICGRTLLNLHCVLLI